VRAGERETGDPLVVKQGAHPTAHGVAGLARGRKVQRLVIRTLGGLEVLRVAAHAVRRQSGKLRRCRSPVTGFAFDHGVGANQRESVLVVLDGLKRYGPAFLTVAFLTSPAKLPAVNICVAS
jgi:hypothetical protein